MLYELFSYLKNTDLPGKDLGNFLSFRAGAAIILSLLITIFFGKYVIRILRRKQIGEDIRDLGLEGQLQKKGTPTMGGIIIITETAIELPVLASPPVAIVDITVGRVFSSSLNIVPAEPTFQSPKNVKSVSVKIQGLIIGNIILEKIPNQSAPSICAASISASGTYPSIYCFIRKTPIDDAKVGNK